VVHSAPSFNCSGGNCGLSKIVLFEKNVNEKKLESHRHGMKDLLDAVSAFILISFQ